MEGRARKVPREVVRRQYEDFLKLKVELKRNPIDFTPVSIHNNPNKPHCIVVDIDGTIADSNGVRNIYDFGKVHLDIPIYDVIESIVNFDGDVIICSGRDERCRVQTEEWLRRYIPFERLYLRDNKDNRADWEVKEEFWNDICDDYYVTMMFDDRLQVVRRARALRFKVANVKYGYY